MKKEYTIEEKIAYFQRLIEIERARILLKEESIKRLERVINELKASVPQGAPPA